MKEHEIALLDDHELMRGGLAAIINGIEGFAVSIEASHGLDFIAKLDIVREPSIAIIDLHMPEMDGFETMTWIQEHRPGILCLALTFDASEESLIKAIRSGARGFLLKKSRPEVFQNALHSLLLTGYYHTPETHAALLNKDGLQTESELHKERLLNKMSPREREFLVLVCNPAELTYEQIAERMGVHRRTVDNYRISLFAKFELKSKVGLVLFAAKAGLLEQA